MRVLNIPDSPQGRNPHDPKLAILFSGGVDCTVLARIVHDLLPVEEEIDLLNVAFENPRVALANKETLKKKNAIESRVLNDFEKSVMDAAVSESPIFEQNSVYDICPDRITGRRGVQELRKVCPERTWRFIEVRALAVQILYEC